MEIRLTRAWYKKHDILSKHASIFSAPEIISPAQTLNKVVHRKICELKLSWNINTYVPLKMRQKCDFLLPAKIKTNNNFKLRNRCHRPSYICWLDHHRSHATNLALSSNNEQRSRKHQVRWMLNIRAVHG